MQGPEEAHTSFLSFPLTNSLLWAVKRKREASMEREASSQSSSLISSSNNTNILLDSSSSFTNNFFIFTFTVALLFPPLTSTSPEPTHSRPWIALEWKT